MTGEREDRLKELMGRMVEMSPEPPPYPGEATATSATRTRKSRPALVLVGAALGILALGLPFVFLSGATDEMPAATTQPPPPAATAGPSPTTIAPAPETTIPTTTVPMVAQRVVVYLVAEPANSYLGNPALVPVTSEVAAPESQASPLTALRLLTDPRLGTPPGLGRAIPEGVEVLGVTQAEGLYTVDMNQAFLDGAGGLLADITMLNQLVFTATAADPGAEVRFTVEGQPVDIFGSEGLVVVDPVSRTDFLDHLNPIIITELALGESPPRIAGLANVFEGTVSLQVLDHDQVVLEDFTTATCGSGCWGEFSFLLDGVELPPTAVIRVFWYSAEDGEPADVVTIPLPGSADGTWDLLPG
ncbi:MAG: Gmad2 immunoglobulin-like domain-containing protein [Acidimicrobiia bacterium]